MKKLFFIFSIIFVLFIGTSVLAQENEYIVRIKPDCNIFLFSDDMEELSSELSIYKTSKEKAEQLQSQGYIINIEKNDEVILFDNEYNDSAFEEQYYFDMLDIVGSQDYIKNKNNVRIAVIDSGIYASHEDLIEADIEEGFNYIKKDTDTIDIDNHGTKVAAIIAATQNNKKGITGINNNVTLVPLVVSYGGKGSTANVIEAIDDAINKYNCKILQISLGVKTYSQSMQDIINLGYEKGIIIIAAVGNSGSSTVYYPVGCDNVIGVGSVGAGYVVSSFSEKNNTVDVVAPGEAIYTTNKNSGYATSSGTSFSCPIVSGLISLFVGEYPNLNYDVVMETIKACTIDLGDSNYDIKYGYGLINAQDMFKFYNSNNDFFVSNVKRVGKTYNVKVYCNSEEDAKILFNIYNDGFIKESIVKDIKQEENIYCFSVEYAANSKDIIKIMVINSFESMKPLISLKNI